MAEELDPKPHLVPAEELADEIEELLRLASRRGKAAEAEALKRQTGRKAGYAVRRRSDKPSIKGELRAALRSALEESVVVTAAPSEHGGIDESEWRREIAKKALLHLSAGSLRRIAEEISVDKRGPREEVVDRIARAYAFDFRRIAELVTNNEEEPRPERGITERLYTLVDHEPDLPGVAARLTDLQGRYIRVGTAQWFIFDKIEEDERRLAIRGTLRSYEALITDEAGDPDLAWTPENATVRLVLRQGAPSIEVRGRTGRTSRAAIRALERAIGVVAQERLEVDPQIREGLLARWDSRSVFMLDLLQARFNTDGVYIHDVTVAQFETGEADREEDLTPRPRVRSVRFEGDHLLSSVSACEFLAAGRGLVNLSFWIRYRPSGAESFLLPLRVTLHNDHIALLTGFGPSGSEVAKTAHGVLLDRLRAAIRSGVSDVPALEGLAAKIEERAHYSGPVKRADILAPETPEDSSPSSPA